MYFFILVYANKSLKIQSKKDDYYLTKNGEFSQKASEGSDLLTELELDNENNPRYKIKNKEDQVLGVMKMDLKWMKEDESDGELWTFLYVKKDEVVINDSTGHCFKRNGYSVMLIKCSLKDGSFPDDMLFKVTMEEDAKQLEKCKKMVEENEKKNKENQKKNDKPDENNQQIGGDNANKKDNSPNQKEKPMSDKKDSTNQRDNNQNDQKNIPQQENNRDNSKEKPKQNDKENDSNNAPQEYPKSDSNGYFQPSDRNQESNNSQEKPSNEDKNIPKEGQDKNIKAKSKRTRDSSSDIQNKNIEPKPKRRKEQSNEDDSYSDHFDNSFGNSRNNDNEKCTGKDPCGKLKDSSNKEMNSSEEENSPLIESLQLLNEMVGKFKNKLSQ